MKKVSCAVWLLAAVMGLSSCSSKDSLYPPAKREEMMKAASIVMEAKYKASGRLRDMRNIQAAEGRQGYSKKVEHSVTFSVSKLLKGKFMEIEITVAIALPSLAFGIQPGEYSGEKIYTLYLSPDPKNKNRLLLIGAEWQKRFKK